MKLLILRSEKTAAEKQPEDHYLQELNTHYADRVIGNLSGNPEFCASCASDCIDCRKPYRLDFRRDIARIIAFPSVLPYILEQPRAFVPPDVPRHDAMLVIAIHDQILLEMLKQCGRWGTQCVIVPLEAPDWLTHSTRTQAIAICKAGGVEIAFPKPFCGFKPPEGTRLAAFRRHFRIGYPEVAITTANNKITGAEVVASAACGSTYYIARWLVGRDLDDDIATEVISKRLHSYPCTASMERDPELDDDTCLHIAGQAHNTILSPVREPAETPVVEEITMVVSPLGKLVQKAGSPTDNLKNIRAAMELVLSELAHRPSATLDHLRKVNASISPAALHSALLLLKKDGKIRMERRDGNQNHVCRPHTP